MLSVRHMMDRLMEDAFVMPRGGQGGGGGPQLSTALNMYEERNNLILEVPLPGIRPEDVEITVERGTLTIRGQMKAEEEREDRNYLVREHRRGNFARSVVLPQTVDPDAAQATFDNGVLQLTFPRREQSRPRRIDIQASGQQAMEGGQAAPGQGASPAAGAHSATSPGPDGQDGQ